MATDTVVRKDEIVSKATIALLYDAHWATQSDEDVGRRLWDLMRQIEAELGLPLSEEWEEGQ